ncbi:pentapeptide repeat-containing protein [Kitasatospora sp. CM 4170]|uniref:Pentapeptide repeat-containing protein n=1 Tax=Kitasatospora aburaviensis TaxID=67265 RepID=A0ABW1F119_9ACTN|nr:pentapeptide repeat-containing protein [Kitasatospora sp. CM 4170]WNM49282.1 pentapeptide repeat-containing protein [Kitasatospora sp. CM 4170]
MPVSCRAVNARVSRSGFSINSVRPLETRAADAQVALTCLGVLGQERPAGWLNVSYTDLRRADCDGLWLNGVNLDGTCLEAASAYQVNLRGASLITANLRHAELGTSILHQSRCTEADLRGARLLKADLREANFSGADLREANLRKARAAGTVFVRADLLMADLRGCDLSGTDLRQAKLEAALASDLTIWPAGFDVEAAGVVVAEDPGTEPDVLLPAAAIMIPENVRLQDRPHLDPPPRRPLLAMPPGTDRTAGTEPNSSWGPPARRTPGGRRAGNTGVRLVGRLAHRWNSTRSSRPGWTA